MTENQRVIIVAGREYPKWKMYTGTHQHLVDVKGRPLLRRTALQFLQHSNDVFVTVPEYAEGTYREALKGLSVAIVPCAGTEASEFEATRGLWADEPGQRTVMPLGDVLFSARTVQTMMTSEQCDAVGHHYNFYGRPGGSVLTGYHAGEGWGYAWRAEDNDEMDRHVARVHQTRAEGSITRPPGWMVLRSWSGLPLQKHRCLPPWFINCDSDKNDYTEDFDTPENYNVHPYVNNK